MTIAAPAANGASTSRPAGPRTNQRPPTALELIRRDEGMPAPPPASEPLAAGFTAEQVAALAAPLDRAKVKQREQGRGRVSYLEGWQVIAEANRIFGFDGWQRQTTSIHCVSQAERSIGRDHRPGWGVTYIARVRVTVAVHGGTPLIREGSGAGHGIDVDLGQAHESALKEAETDAMKRALAPADPGLAELDPSTIRQLHTTLRSLPAPLLAGFTKAFRKRFQVPGEAPSIADRICQRQHHDWIEAFLVQHQAPASNQPGTQQA